ncbi:YxcD family protein [Fictibacillus gelatini]|uniref:YxcD family protein n=1 Tax=Fictibacillus gelatini TaxID=225985 RepID=UPI0004130B31|nr:YxcD family protein [Fictibacillus gelatini]
MEKITLFEQDVVNALCLFTANKRGMTPEEIEVELLYDDDYGFSAEVYANGRKQVLIEANIIEALRFWLDSETNIDPVSAGIELVLDDDEGIIAIVKYH